MDIKSLAELGQPDERSLFWVLGGATSPDWAAKHQQELMSQLDISVVVPEAVRLSFERLRTLYAYGFLCYDLYTVAGDLARLVTEEGLRARFVEFYGGAVSFTDEQGKTEVVRASTFDELYRGIRHQDGRLRRWAIQLRSGRKPFVFTGGLNSLLRWARAEQLLRGQGDRMRDDPRKWFRDHVAHHTYELYGPDQAARAIADVSHIINSLWGAPSGTSVHREAVIIAWSEERVTWGLAVPRAGEGDTAVVVLADPDDRGLPQFDSLYESTNLPCDLLWGPCSPEEAHQWREANVPPADDAETIDRLLLLRQDGDRLYMPQRAAIIAAQFSQGDQAIWYLLRADWPAHAFNHQRRLLAGEPGHQDDGPCNSCPVDTVGSGTLRKMLRRAAALGEDITPRPVADTRVTMSMIPRCNRILGSGAWDIPPDDPMMRRLLASQDQPTANLTGKMGAS